MNNYRRRKSGGKEAWKSAAQFTFPHLLSRSLSRCTNALRRLFFQRRRAFANTFPRTLVAPQARQALKARLSGGPLCERQTERYSSRALVYIERERERETESEMSGRRNALRLMPLGAAFFLLLFSCRVRVSTLKFSATRQPMQL